MVVQFGLSDYDMVNSFSDVLNLRGRCAKLPNRCKQCMTYVRPVSRHVLKIVFWSALSVDVLE